MLLGGWGGRILVNGRQSFDRETASALLAMVVALSLVRVENELANPVPLCRVC